MVEIKLWKDARIDIVKDKGAWSPREMNGAGLALIV
jgi:hypothetical protein